MALSGSDRQAPCYLIAQLVKNPPAMRETWVRSLDEEDPLEKEMAKHSRILVWRVLWTEEPSGVQWATLVGYTGSQRVRHDLKTKLQLTPCMLIEKWIR